MTPECELLTVLTFHHPGLVEQAAAAAAAEAVDADIRKGWTAAPTRHLPFVPCRLQARDVIMQASEAEGDAGSRRLRARRRLSQTASYDNSSFGGANAVNADVADA
eukprot:1060841-Pleurochrysis_carterae.AAC.1